MNISSHRQKVSRRCRGGARWYWGLWSLLFALEGSMLMVLVVDVAEPVGLRVLTADGEVLDPLPGWPRTVPSPLELEAIRALALPPSGPRPGSEAGQRSRWSRSG